MLDGRREFLEELLPLLLMRFPHLKGLCWRKPTAMNEARSGRKPSSRNRHQFLFSLIKQLLFARKSLLLCQEMRLKQHFMKFHKTSALF